MEAGISQRGCVGAGDRSGDSPAERLPTAFSSPMNFRRQLRAAFRVFR